MILNLIVVDLDSKDIKRKVKHLIKHWNNEANTRHSANAGTMLGQRRRRWADIVPTIYIG